MTADKLLDVLNLYRDIENLETNKNRFEEH